MEANWFPIQSQLDANQQQQSVDIANLTYVDTILRSELRFIESNDINFVINRLEHQASTYFAICYLFHPFHSHLDRIKGKDPVDIMNISQSFFSKSGVIVTSENESSDDLANPLSSALPFSKLLALQYLRHTGLRENRHFMYP